MAYARDTRESNTSCEAPIRPNCVGAPHGRDLGRLAVAPMGRSYGLAATRSPRADGDQSSPNPSAFPSSPTCSRRSVLVAPWCSM